MAGGSRLAGRSQALPLESLGRGPAARPGSDDLAQALAVVVGVAVLIAVGGLQLVDHRADSFNQLGQRLAAFSGAAGDRNAQARTAAERARAYRQRKKAE